MGQVSVTHLGLAAYMRMQGAKIIRVEGKTFLFESDRPIGEWRVEYNNSCCMRHDTFVCELRHNLKAQ